jgi:hypothetical protein
MSELVLVRVTWNDAWQDQENFTTQHGVAQTHHPLPVETIGWLLVDDEVGISVANEKSTDSGQTTFRGRTFIPRAMVASVEPFRPARAKRRQPAINADSQS